MWRSFSLILILCIVIGINCWSGDNCDGCRSEYTRNKRGKYYSIPSYKYYKRPIYSYPNRGSIYMSHGYTPNDIAPPTKIRPYKVRNHPINEGLGDEDFNNLMKYLSNKDLDKLVEFAAEKELYSDKYRDHTDNYESSDDYEEDSSKVYPYGTNSQYKYNTLYNPSTNYPHGQFKPMYIQEHNINTEESEETEQFPQLDEYFQKEIKLMSNKNNIYTDSSTMSEEELPRPINLREDDYEGSFTNNVPSVANPDTAYKLESFADLPLMEYIKSKTEKVNSYSVPHYSVISPSNHRPRFPSSPSLPSQLSSSLSPSILSLINAPEVEPAPPVSTAKEQSDAHLKATKIWTHKSKGTAYTLHDDGTLSLENQARPRYKFP